MKRNVPKLILENFQKTFFASIFENDERETLIGIKEINEQQAILFRFPKRTI